jgi:tetratricopeptide (TPR) repeat protein
MPTTLARHMKRHPWTTLFAAAFAARAVFVLQWMRTPLGRMPLLDAKSYETWAMDILAGHLVREKAFYQSPFYPYFLAVIYKILGHHHLPVLMMQAAVSAATGVLIGLIAKELFGERAGLAAGSLAAAYRPFIFQSALLHKETWGLLGLASFVFMALKAERRGRRSDFVWSGILLGFTALSRGNVLLLAPAAAAWWLWRRRKQAVPGVVACFLGLGAAVLPATIHNFMASRDLVLINYTGGFDFFVGNNPSANGLPSWPNAVSAEPAQEETDTARIAEAALGHPLKPSAVSRWWFMQGLRFIADSPGRALKLVWTKTRLYWNRYEAPDAYDVSFVSRTFWTLLRLPLLSFGLLVPLAALGLALRPREAGLLAALSLGYMGSALLFYVNDRYRLPQAVFLLPFCGAGLVGLLDAFRSRQWSGMFRPLACAVPAALIAYAPLPVPSISDAVSWGQLAYAEHDLGETAACLDDIDRALAIDPTSIGFAPVVAATKCQDAAGAGPDGDRRYAAFLRVYPDRAMLHNNHGVYLLKAGRKEEAVQELERATELDPHVADWFKNLAFAYAAVGRRDAARVAQRTAEDLSPRPKN